jgi:hypothetical protein
MTYKKNRYILDWRHNVLIMTPLYRQHLFAMHILYAYSFNHYLKNLLNCYTVRVPNIATNTHKTFESVTYNVHVYSKHHTYVSVAYSRQRHCEK